MTQQKLRQQPTKLAVISFFVCASFLQACGGSSGSFESDQYRVSDQTCPVDPLSANDLSYFEEAPGDVEPALLSGQMILRKRKVRVQSKALAEHFEKAPYSSLKLDLFPNLKLEIKPESVRKYGERNWVVSGRLSGAEKSSVTLALKGEAFVGQIVTEAGRAYELLTAANGLNDILEVSALESEDCEALPAPKDPNDGISEDEESGETPIIDMLVAYTPSAMAKMGGQDGIEALIQTGIEDTNKAFLNSGVNLSVRLIGMMAVTQNETNQFSSDLSSLKGQTDGLWDEVHAERLRLGADQVTMVGVYPSNSVAGIGYIGSGISSAFTIAKVSAFSRFTFSHELGHNIGLNHSDGFVNTSGGFRTIMAYGTYPRIRRFSNPEYPYKFYYTGDSSHHSASILNANGLRVALFKVPKVPVVDVEVPESPTLPPKDPGGCVDE
ncbi:MAG: reprolysin-like metallopeptidase [Pseudobdellovibrionaceae bacterium]